MEINSVTSKPARQQDPDAIQDVEKAGHDNNADRASFKQMPQLNVGGHGATQRRLRNYQVTMIGFCSGIGTGLFVGTGAAYSNAGPAGLFLAFTVVGAVLWCVMQSISELATVVSDPYLHNNASPRRSRC